MGKECLVVPREGLVGAGFIPKDSEGRYTYTRVGSIGDLKRLIALVYSSGEYRERFGDYGIENDPTVQQLIMYGFFLRDDGRFLVYQRGRVENYAESRLAGKISIGIGGHMERTDLNLAQSFYREFDEEAQILIGGRPVNLRNENDSLNISLIRDYIRIKPCGLIKDDINAVGKVHLGIACQIVPKIKKIDICVRTDDGEENSMFQYFTPDEYQALQSQGQIMLESWAELVYREEILSRLQEIR